jgi:hypothetical protein
VDGSLEQVFLTLTTPDEANGTVPPAGKSEGIRS